MSHVVEVIADSTGRWIPNDLRFRTKVDATEYALNLEMRWMSVRDWRVVPSEQPANAVWTGTRAVSLPVVRARGLR